MRGLGSLRSFCLFRCENKYAERSFREVAWEKMRCRRKEGQLISQLSSEKEILGCFFFSFFSPKLIVVSWAVSDSVNSLKRSLSYFLVNLSCHGERVAWDKSNVKHWKQHPNPGQQIEELIRTSCHVFPIPCHRFDCFMIYHLLF